ncbi:hypothetical protein MFIFM68171_06522 [Madurella fahalii]|uniref:Uncharacterized protein n=1 Tax=Madurella fahalii TaxID=1157608 RepID=A0ABQ0GEY5_9PEZI
MAPSATLVQPVRTNGADRYSAPSSVVDNNSNLNFAGQSPPGSINNRRSTPTGVSGRRIAGQPLLEMAGYRSDGDDDLGDRSKINWDPASNALHRLQDKVNNLRSVIEALAANVEEEIRKKDKELRRLREENQALRDMLDQSGTRTNDMTMRVKEIEQEVDLASKRASGILDTIR